jgi:hypothetical protein
MTSLNEMYASLTPPPTSVDHLVELPPKETFSDLVLDFLSKLSEVIIQDRNARNFPDLIEFAKWCRESHLLFLKSRFFSQRDLRVGRGLIFHIAPSNVPLNFAYSLVSGLLAGNANIVRLPSTPFEQSIILLKHIREVLQLKYFIELNSFINLVTYPRESKYTEVYSQICDVRVIWGGDSTINSVREYKIQPKAFDITFPDRYSFSVIKSSEICKIKDLKKVVLNFYNDTFYTDQNACTSPHLIVWVGSDLDNRNAKRIFWDSLLFLVEGKYKNDSNKTLTKLTKLYEYMSINPILSNLSSPQFDIVRINLNDVVKNISDFKSSCGLFYEYECDDLLSINKFITRKYQTLSYFGFEESSLRNFFELHRFLGVDRVVPIGKTQDFNLVWDGHDLISNMSRIMDFS